MVSLLSVTVKERPPSAHTVSPPTEKARLTFCASRRTLYKKYPPSYVAAIFNRSYYNECNIQKFLYKEYIIWYNRKKVKR
jgi:polyphosphate kinase 2 (PPK2 family)